ncbi:hypothetical protein R80B4_00175 [Fibrobacteres bacterium R8-0-B4]
MNIFTFTKFGRALPLAAVLAVGLLGCDESGGGDDDETHAHTWGDWVVTTPATCDAPGVETRICAQNNSHTETRATTAVNPNTVVKGTLTDDRDGKKYKTITLCRQTWMAENLNYEAGDSSWCRYTQNVYGFAFSDNVKRSDRDDWDCNCDKYGRYYDWNTAQTVCPSGYHLPSIEDWMVLLKAVGVNGEYRGAIKDILPYDRWIGFESIRLRAASWDGTDDYGFAALPGGCVDRDCVIGGGWIEPNDNTTGYWWSSSVYYSDGGDDSDNYAYLT